MTSTERRVASYGGFPLTARQRRRAAKKDRQANRRPAAFVSIGTDRWECLDDRMTAVDN